MLAILRLIRPAWRGLAGALGLAVLATGSGVALLAVSAWLITRAAGMPPVLTLIVAIVGVRAFGIGRAVFRYAERLVAHDAALKALVDIRVRLYRGLERTAPQRFWGSGELLQRLSGDVDAVADLLIRGWLPLLSSGVVIVGAVLLLCALLPAAGLAVLVAVLTTLAMAVVAARRSSGLDAELARVRSDRVRVVTETVQAGADPAVLLGTRWTGELAAADDAEVRLGAALGRWSGAAAAVAVGAFGVSVALSWWLGRSAGVGGETLAILVLLPLALTDVAVALAPALSEIVRGRQAAARLFEVIDLAGDEAAPALGDTVPLTAGGLAVEVRGLEVRYPGRPDPALTGIDLDLRPGRRIAVVGPSGSGKSTLLNALLGFAPVTGGSVGVDGRPDPDATRRSMMSLCDQQAYLFDSSILENVRLARADATDAEVSLALDAAQLRGWIETLPAGMHTRVGYLGAMISGGQRQRIAFARALLARRPILLLDEPTAGLDQATGRALIREMLDAGPDVCVVLVTHEIDRLEGFDEVLELSAQRRVVVG